MSMNPSGWRPEMSVGTDTAAAPTFTGNRALMLEEPLIFEIGDGSSTGVDIAEAPRVADRLGGLARNRPIGLAGLRAGRAAFTVHAHASISSSAPASASTSSSVQISVTATTSPFASPSASG